MSASYVRNLFRQWCDEVAQVENVPFYDTINTRQRPTDQVWFTCEFVAEAHEGNFCDRQYREAGFAAVVFVARPGIGDMAALAAVETVIPALMLKEDPNGKLSLDSYDPLQDDSGGSADSDYRISVVVNYSYSKG